MSQPQPSPQPPARRVSQMIVSLWVPQAVHAAAELGVADALAAGPASAAALARRLGTHEDATLRLLLGLTTLGLLARSGDAFALTELGGCLASDAPVSMRAWSRLMGGAPVWHGWERLAECVRTGRPAGQLDGARTSAEEMFDGMDADAAAVFHRAMADLTGAVAPHVVAAAGLSDARRIADVGGGYGALLCAALLAAPQATGLVTDLAHPRDGALALFAARGLQDRATFVASNVFEEPPPPADVYFLKSVIHDWDDADALRILARCREALRDGARLLVVEAPAPEERTGAFDEWMIAFSDLNMLVNTGGRERTLRAYVDLFGRAGLRVRAVRPTATGFYRVFEVVR